jgi:hypothetical protein
LRRSLVVSVRGTAAFTDIASDLASRAVGASDLFFAAKDASDGDVFGGGVERHHHQHHHHHHHHEGNPRAVMAHEGVLCAARMLVASRVGDIVEEQLCRLPPDYKLVLTGHSLGGAVAILVSLLLLKRLERSSRSGDLARAQRFHDHDVTPHHSSSPSLSSAFRRRKITCYAFGPPPCLTGAYVWPGGSGSQSDGCNRIWEFSCTSFVNRDDPVPSVCLRSCYELIGDMVAVDRSMQEITMGWRGRVRLMCAAVFSSEQGNRNDQSADALALGRAVAKAVARRADIVEPEFLRMVSEIPFLTLPGRVVHMTEMPSRVVGREERGRSAEKRRASSVIRMHSEGGGAGTTTAASWMQRPSSSGSRRSRRVGRITDNILRTTGTAAPPMTLLCDRSATARARPDRVPRVIGPRAMMSHSFGEYTKVLERLAARAPQGEGAGGGSRRMSL